jgi:uncharacterized phage-associated protein
MTQTMSIDRRQPPYDARQIANALLDIATSRGVELTNMAVNKLIFFSHAHYLVTYGRALVHNPFEAWDHGPVSPAVYAEFRQFGASPISSRATVLDVASNTRHVAPTNLGDSDRRFVVRVFDVYGGLDALTLSDLTHEKGGAWDQARTAFRESANFGKRISNEIIQKAFESAVTH